MAHPTLDELLAKDEPILVPGVWDPLLARMLTRAGAPCLMVGGWVTGASLAVTEPLLSLTEQVEVAGRVARAVEAPVIADGHTGFGEPVHVMRSVREYEAAGLAGMHLEDQLFPKRAHYHANVKHVIELPRMLEKLSYALKARRDPAFKIIARTDSHDAVGGSLDETIGRLRAFVEVGADMLMPFPSPGDNPKDFDLGAAREVRAAVPAVPMIWLAGETGSEAEPDVRTIYQAGYKIIFFPISFIVATSQAAVGLYEDTARRGKVIIDDNDAVKAEIEAAIGLPEMFEIERQTVETEAGA